MWMILLIALGVAGTVSTFSLLRAVSSNSFAAKAHRLFTPQIDNHGPEYQKIYGEIDPVLTLRDVEALRAHDSAHLQAAIYKSVFHSFLVTRLSMRSKPTAMLRPVGSLE
jgi:putative ABC transport system permease protein